MRRHHVEGRNEVLLARLVGRDGWSGGYLEWMDFLSRAFRVRFVELVRKLATLGPFFFPS